MTSVVSLFGGGAQNEPNADIIEDLEAILSAAKRGEIRAIAWTRMGPSGDIITGWNGDAGTRNALGFAVRMLDADFVRRAFETTSDISTGA
jgi:hypothetical protein